MKHIWLVLINRSPTGSLCVLYFWIIIDIELPNIQTIYMGKSIIHYPRLSSTDLGIFRVGGAGLANCMFVVARAYIEALKDHGKIINPTWRKLSIGPILRKERDKRLYNMLFNSIGIHGLAKCYYLIKNKIFKNSIITHSGLKNYFRDLIPYHDEIINFYDQITRDHTSEILDNEDFNNVIGVHIRLGDYLPQYRVSLDWFIKIIKQIKENPLYNNFLFFIFSDGSDQELQGLLEIENVERKFYGNAYNDMRALSRCKMIIASDSTFSAWGAFLGKVPIVFNKCHFNTVFDNPDMEIILGENTSIDEHFLKRIVS